MRGPMIGLAILLAVAGATVFALLRGSGTPAPIGGAPTAAVATPTTAATGAVRPAPAVATAPVGSPTRPVTMIEPAGPFPTPGPPEKPLDYVCRNRIEGETTFRAMFQGVTYLFCSDACRLAFEADPVRYTGGLPGIPHPPGGGPR